MRATLTRFALVALRTVLLGLGFLAVMVVATYLAGYALLRAQAAGIEPTGFAIFSGAVLVAGVLALRTILADIAAGIFLLLSGAVRTGDRIETGGLMGIVRRIGLRTCDLASADGLRYLIPNTQLTSRPVLNATSADGSTTISLRITVTGKTNPEAAIAALERAALTTELILQRPPTRVSLVALGPAGLEFLIGAHVAKPADASPAEAVLHLRVVKTLNETGIEIPNRQHDVHLRDLDVVKVLLARLIQERTQSKPGGEPEDTPL